MRAPSSFRPTRRAFLGAVLAFGVSGEAMALTPAQRVVRAARRQVGVTLTYDPAYSVLRFPNGDVDRAKGVCTDVVIRAFRDALGADLQALVNADMRANFGAYPKNWGLGRPDRNIDHRRVPNLATYWRRQGASLPVTDDPADWRPGDIFTQMVGGRMPHTGIVSDRKDTTGVPLVLHNIGGGTREEDALFDHPLTGHFRWKV
ncbi:conserved exported protein of unknown function [uncultured Sphingopyxis sp.]|uniref:DUF1287 domain-containing protein n=1 Tax=uncultured Sphingopyxis sp. TaxID=310581 RepID=A0A1Y5PVL7_9SPHN|nr:DUF1287 domain-containing protein [uncultured Sphingopyxis sp.]SBV31274.1 conserved exported protein of unknown function [uncultured Sphingopyxis sp.]